MKPIGITAIDRRTYKSFALDTINTNLPVPAGRLSTETVLSKYAGFEGCHWPEWVGIAEPRDGLLPMSMLGELEAAVQRGSPEHTADIVLISRDKLDTQHEKNWSFRGIDLGEFNSSDSLFSVVFQEILLGQNVELTRLSDQLNEDLLPHTLETVYEIVRTRSTLEANGADLESISQIHSYFIYSPTRPIATGRR